LRREAGLEWSPLEVAAVEQIGLALGGTLERVMFLLVGVAEIRVGEGVSQTRPGGKASTISWKLCVLNAAANRLIHVAEVGYNCA